ncbi:MAG: dihydroorotate dehydrogenase [Thermoplasmata archaeon]|nr:MAG: dihydroorotate dehydrogenase [Thermoplasmata archaeon]
MVDITVEIAGLKLEKPTILASGIMDEDAGAMKRVFESDAGAVVTKSIGLKPREGYPNPTVIELEYGILNAIGLSNPGVDNFEDEIKILKKMKIPVIGSIFGSTTEEFVKVASKMENYGVDALELNMSCPHAKGYGLEIGSKPELVKKITFNVKKTVDIPVFVKLSPNLTDIVAIAKAAEKGNADGIVAVNTVKAMKIDINLRKPVLSNRIGGYSGKAIKPIGIRCVYEISKNIDIPVIGVGGITTGEDAIEYFMAGAHAVQIGSGVYYRKIDVFRKINTEIKNWMRNNGYKKLSELVGVAHI